MTGATMTAGHRAPWLLAVGVGLALGVAYTLSPLTIVVVATLFPLWRLASRGLSERERYWLAAILFVAVAIRLLAIGGLFLTADQAKPFATFFGDEELFKTRTVWLRNIGMDVPISKADMIYVFDDIAQSSYLYVLAYIQALVGIAPYGVHLFNMLLYLCAVVGLYRLVRTGFGGVAAMGGLAVLLFIPSLLVWSVSALKEPLYTIVAAGELVCAVLVTRAPRRWQRVLAVAGVVAGAFALQGVRNGGLVVVGVGAAGGLALGLALTRPRVLLAGTVALALTAPVLLTRPAVEGALLRVAQTGVFNHTGHLLTPGKAYLLVDPRYYDDRFHLWKMPSQEAARFVVDAIAAYFVVPLPQHVDSTAIAAYLPEQFVWLVVVLLVPAGVAAGLRRDPVLTSLLAAHAFAAVVTVALNSGNIGTLIRHRGLAWPYLAFLGALGACDLLRRTTARSEPPMVRMEPT